jgi:iron complex outermembrane receptor protein
MMLCMTRRAGAVLAAALMICLPAPGQETPSPEKDDVLVLDAVVVSGRKVAADGTGEKRIRGEALRTHKVVDLAEVLADEMVEATMIRKAGYGNEVSLRGFAKSNLRISLDDSIVEGACGSRKDPSLSHVNMLEIERIEVREGPFDVTSPGALGGGIDVQSREPRSGLHGEILTKVGSFDYGSLGGYVTGGNEWIQGLLGYNYSTSGQYEDGDGNRLSTFTTTPYLPQYEDMDAFEKQDVWGKIRLTPSAYDTFLFEYSYGDAEDILYPRGPFDIPHERTSLARASYTRTELGAWSDMLTLSAYRNLVRHYPSQEYRGNAPKPEAISQFTGGKVENMQTTEFATLTYGVDVYRRRWHAEVFNAFTGALLNGKLIPDVETLNVGTYLQADKEIDDWALSAGLRHDWQRIDARRELSWGSEAGNEPSRREGEFSGFASAFYQLTERVDVFGGVGRSVRMPNGVERYLQGGGTQYGNPDLDPILNTEIDLGVGYVGERFEIRGKVFHSDLQDFIYQEVNGAGVATWGNIDARVVGGDVKGRVELGRGFSVEAGLAMQRGRKRDQPQNNEDRDLAEIPPWKSKLALAYASDRLTAELEWVHSGKAEYVDLDAGEKELASWDVLNLRVGYQISENVSLNAGVNNLLDEDYAVANSYEWDVLAGAASTPAIIDEPGRFLYASLSYRF